MVVVVVVVVVVLCCGRYDMHGWCAEHFQVRQASATQLVSIYRSTTRHTLSTRTPPAQLATNTLQRGILVGVSAVKTARHTVHAKIQTQ